MNEQLIVKNFGPIKDAIVDFKRVTVFIGPTGGGKSTLAKLAAIFRDGIFFRDDFYDRNRSALFKNYLIDSFFSNESFFQWTTSEGDVIVTDKALKFDNKLILERGRVKYSEALENPSSSINQLLEGFKNYIDSLPENSPFKGKGIGGIPMQGATTIPLSLMQGQELDKLLHGPNTASLPVYIPSERIFISAINNAWPGLMSENIGLPKSITTFANLYFQAREAASFLRIPFLKIDFFRSNQQDLIVLGNQLPLKILETASGIQSVTPMLVLLEHLSRNTEHAQSFIIEEPELNLYPTAQQGLLNWLVEKCTKGENDLTITTHSPYLLAHFNTLLFAYQVAQNHPERADEIAKVVPRESWINPAEFAAYHVEGQQENGVRSIVNPETGLISYNGLDAIASAEASEFEKLLDINAGLSVEW